MEVEIISEEMIKPSSSTTSLLQPYKLCLFDQLTPATYGSFIFFYLNFPHNLTHLKDSLSKLLNIFYPFSGRIQNNLFINRFDAGLLFLQARVKLPMSEFLQRFDEEAVLNQLLAFRPLFRESSHDQEASPLIAFQANQFACGGIAIGISLCHKLCDGMTLRILLKSWAAIVRGSYNEVKRPNLHELSSLFPPRQPLPQHYVDLMEPFWFKEAGNNVMRRFVFSHSALAALRAKAKSKSFPNPSRTQTLSALIWKHATTALKIIPGAPQTSIFAQVVNMRPRMMPNMSSEAMGNPIWWATVAANPAEMETTELHQIVGVMDKAISRFDSKNLSGEKEMSAETVAEDYFKKLQEDVFSSEKSVVFVFTSWTTLFKDIDFGLGVPVWITPLGKAGPEFANFVVFTEARGGSGIEAWASLDENIMTILEHDTEFLAVTAVNTAISRL